MSWCCTGKIDESFLFALQLYLKSSHFYDLHFKTIPSKRMFILNHSFSHKYLQRFLLWIISHSKETTFSRGFFSILEKFSDYILLPTIFYFELSSDLKVRLNWALKNHLGIVLLSEWRAYINKYYFSYMPPKMVQ